MSRRYRTVGVKPLPSALGDIHVDVAVSEINNLCHRTVAVMTEYPHTREATLPMLFPQDVLDRARAARGIIDPSMSWEDYLVAPFVQLNVDYRDCVTPTITGGAFNAVQPSARPLMEFIEQVRRIYLQFEEIKAVLRWLNRNATPGAIRYYWPPALSVCPDSPPLKALQHVPTRYTMPKNINDWAHLLRDTAAVYAGTQMLPSSAGPTLRRKLWLTFQTTEVTSGAVRFTTDAMTFNI